jgi:hypothetical protein
VVFNKEIHQSEKNLAFFFLGCIRESEVLVRLSVLDMCDDGETTSTTGSGCQTTVPQRVRRPNIP